MKVDITYWKGANLGPQRKEFMKKNFRLEELPPPDEWISVGDRLPEKDGVYFVYSLGDNGKYYKDIALYESEHDEWTDVYSGKPWDKFSGFWLEELISIDDKL